MLFLFLYLPTFLIMVPLSSFSFNEVTTQLSQVNDVVLSVTVVRIMKACALVS